jgi:nucleoside-diphosphate-sugar epimerase
MIDFVWIDDVVGALIRAGFGEYVRGPVNIASGHSIALSEVAQRVLLVTGSSSRIRYEAGRTIEVTKFEADITMSQHLFHLELCLDPLRHLGDVVDSIRSEQGLGYSTPDSHPPLGTAVLR